MEQIVPTVGLVPAEAETKRLILEAVSGFDLSCSAAWPRLETLSDRTKFEALEANTHGVFLDSPSNTTFQAVADVYVTLQFGRDAVSESFPAEVRGRIDPKSKRVLVEYVDVDTSSFDE